MLEVPPPPYDLKAVSGESVKRFQLSKFDRMFLFRHLIGQFITSITCKKEKENIKKGNRSKIVSLTPQHVENGRLGWK